MFERAIDALAVVFDIAGRNLIWMGWNTILALIPLWLAARLFRRPDQRRGRISWWLGLIAFLAFLPNAPYVLTDLIHLPRDVVNSETPWRFAFIVVPEYLVFCAVGFGSYVVSLIWLIRMLRQKGWSSSAIAGMEFAIHFASAVGIYLGRFVRFNSWDLVSRPTAVVAEVRDVMDGLGPPFIIGVFFVGLCVLYWPAKHIVIAVVSYIRSGEVRRSHHLIERYL